MEEAIAKLKQLARDNNVLADGLESGKIDMSLSNKRREDLIRTYRYWSQCLFIAAWLLAQNETPNP